MQSVGCVVLHLSAPSCTTSRASNKWAFEWNRTFCFVLNAAVRWFRAWPTGQTDLARPLLTLGPNQLPTYVISYFHSRPAEFGKRRLHLRALYCGINFIFGDRIYLSIALIQHLRRNHRVHWTLGRVIAVNNACYTTFRPGPIWPPKKKETFRV